MSHSVWTANRIKDLRRGLGWSQAELARQLGCRQQTVSEWETNAYQPQNAYSQLLEKLLFDLESQNHITKVSPVAESVMTDLGMSQIEMSAAHDEAAQNRTDGGFDLGID